jgi:hypothetical protein
MNPSLYMPLVQTASCEHGDRLEGADIASCLERSVMRPMKDALRRLGGTETPTDEAVALAALELASTDLAVVKVDEKTRLSRRF